MKQLGRDVPPTLGERLRRAAAKAYKDSSIELGVTPSPPTITTGTSTLDPTLTNLEGLGALVGDNADELLPDFWLTLLTDLDRRRIHPG